MTSINIKKIIEEIKNKYGSLDNPRFDFVSPMWEYGNVIFNIQSLCIEHNYAIEDISDRNDQVCFSYLISHGNIRYNLKLSIVGLYCFLMKRDEKEHLFAHIASSVDIANEFERKLLDVLRNFTLLDKETLLTPIPLKMEITAPERTMIFHALFSDNNIIPL